MDGCSVSTGEGRVEAEGFRPQLGLVSFKGRTVTKA